MFLIRAGSHARDFIWYGIRASPTMEGLQALGGRTGSRWPPMSIGHAGQRRGQFTWRARYDEFRTAPRQSICIRMGMREIDATVITFQPRLRRRRPRAHVEAHFAAYHNFRRKRSMR